MPITSHIFFGSLNVGMLFWSRYCFASVSDCPPAKQTKIGSFDFVRSFAVSRGSVICCGVRRMIMKEVFVFLILFIAVS